MSPSVLDIANCGDEHLDRYCADDTTWAWPAYDFDPSPGRFVPADLLAPAFLDTPVAGRRALAVLHGGSDSPFRALGIAIAAAVENTEAQSAAFEDQPLDGESPWQLAVAAFEACQLTSGIKTTTVSKILHRKLPSLVPINDRLVRQFYDMTASENRWNLCGALTRRCERERCFT